MSKWQERFSVSLEGLNKEELTMIVDSCYRMANLQSGERYTNGTERDIWKAKAKMAVEKRKELTE